MLVVIDTLNRSLAGSESKDEDMSAYIQAADAIREPSAAQFDRSSLWCRRHAAPGTYLAGGAVDAQIAVTRDVADNIVATVEWIKDGPEGDVILSRLEQVDLGTDEDGEPVNSCVIVPVEGKPVQPQHRARLSARQQLAIEALTETILTAGAAAPNSLGLPASTIVVPVDAWRKEMFARGAIDKDAANPREDCRRVQQQLHARHIIGVRDDLVWKVNA